jgi:type II secretion system protein N
VTNFNIGRRTVTLPDLPPWAGRAARYVGYPAFGLFIFVSVLYLSLPWSRAKDRLEMEASAAGYDVQIGSLGPAFLFGLSASDVIVRPHPAPGQKSARTVLDKVVVHPSLLALLVRRVSVDFRLRGLGGEVAGWIGGSTDFEAEVDVRDIDLAQVPGIEAAATLPIAGLVRASAELALPRSRFSEAKGEVKLDCKDFAVGDGQAKLKIPGDPFLSQGLTVPKIKIGNPEGKITVDKGVARMVGIEAHGPDLEMKLEGDVALRDPVGFSAVNLCLAFRPTPALAKREAAVELLTKQLDQTAKRTDGYYGLRITGRLDSMFFAPARCGGGAGPVGPAPGVAGPLPRSGFPGAGVPRLPNAPQFGGGTTTVTVPPGGAPPSMPFPSGPPGQNFPLPPGYTSQQQQQVDAAAPAPAPGATGPIHFGAPIRGTVVAPPAAQPEVPAQPPQAPEGEPPPPAPPEDQQ